jgi:hypothetical protein
MNKMNVNTDALLCIFCRNSTIISTDKPINCILNKSKDDEDTGMYSICFKCNKYSNIVLGSTLYNESYYKFDNIITDIKHNPKLIQITNTCLHCNKDTKLKMFAYDDLDLNYKVICMECDNVYYLNMKS